MAFSARSPMLQPCSTDWTSPAGLLMNTSDTHVEELSFAEWLEVARVAEEQSREIAELVVSNLTPESLKLMATEFFSAVHRAVFRNAYAELRDLLEDWVEVADVESNPDAYARIRAAHKRASKGE